MFNEGKIVSIPKAILEVSLWNTSELYVYALSRSCIGISPKVILQWKLNALHWEKVKCITTPKAIKLRLPLILFRFYNLIQKEVKFTLVGSRDIVLMIITSEGEFHAIPKSDQKQKRIC